MVCVKFLGKGQGYLGWYKPKEVLSTACRARHSMEMEFDARTWDVFDKR